MKSNKNDTVDAEAICEAVGRANMRYAPAKSEDPQYILQVHRTRACNIKHRTALANQIRGFLLEYGVVIRQGRRHLHFKLRELLADEDSTIPEKMPSCCLIIKPFWISWIL